MIFLVFLCLTIFSGLASAQNVRIVSGDIVTDRSKFAYQVSLQLHGSHVCGGTIIDIQNVLTAAHCVLNSRGDPVDPSSLTVVAGGLNIFDDTNNVFKKVERIFVHEEFSVGRDFFKNDIAVLKIDGNFSFTERVNLVELGVATPSTNTQCVVSGWGITYTSNGEFSADLQSVTVPSIPFQRCSNMYNLYNVTLDKKFMCAGDGGKDTCLGDAGGPLVCNEKLAGVVTDRKGCGADQFPGVYTDVSKFVDWINNVQKEKSSGLKSSLSLSVVVGVLLVGSLF